MSTSITTGVTVVGGGLAGLITACEVAEAGAPVHLLDARRRLGGRATSSPEPYVANLGPHALYTGTVLWDWLRARDLHGPASMPRSPRIVFRWRGRIRRTPPAALLPALRLRGVEAPVDVDLRQWVTGRWGAESADALAGVTGALTFHHDPGSLSAAFVVERIKRILLHPAPTARYVAGGWSALVARLETHALALGVRIETEAAVDPAAVGDLAGRGPLVVAVEPGAARRLLGEAAAPSDGRKVALLDVGLRRRRGDPYIIGDLDEAAFSTRPSAIVPTLAPPGHEVVQISAGMRPGESLAAGEARLEAVFDLAMPDWRTRVEWRRRAALTEATGAVDLPGSTWRDRPAIAHADGVWLAGDWVASPGHLAEVSATSAVTAAAHAVAATRPHRVAAR